MGVVLEIKGGGRKDGKGRNTVLWELSRPVRRKFLEFHLIDKQKKRREEEDRGVRPGSSLGGK